MEDPVLNRNLEETRELQTRWSQFRDFVKMAQQQRGKINPQAEMKFLELKSRIAMLHDSFMSGLKHDPKVGQNIIQIVGDCIMLKRIAVATDAEKQKFEFDWNEGYMLLTEQVSSLDEEKKRLAGINERAYKAAQQRDLWKARFNNFVHGTYLKVATFLIVTFMVLYGIPAFGIFSYREFYKMSWSKPVYVFFSNTIYRPYIDKNYDYDNGDAVEFDEAKEPEKTNERIRTLGTEAFGIDTFKTYVLPAIGITDPASIEQGKKLVDENISYTPYHYQADGVDVFFFKVIFKSSVDAATFVKLAQDGMKKLSQGQQDVILGKNYIQRRANFVLFGCGDHILHSMSAEEKWLFPKKAPNLLAQFN